MHEKLLHYIWQSELLLNQTLTTTDGSTLKIISKGNLNHNSGPDFFNSLIQINLQKWAGNIEIHVKASDWYGHRHEVDPSYDGIILHVVWDHDTDIYRADGSVIPTLELKNFTPKHLIKNYQKLVDAKPKFIKCEGHFDQVDQLKLNAFLEHLYFERLEAKYQIVQQILKQSHNDWEATLFKFMLKYFGLNINGDSFFSIGNSIDFSVFRKCFEDPLMLESILLGQAGLLEQEHTDAYFNELRLTYLYQKSKYGFANEGVIPAKFFRLRPMNFPTIRLSQFANLYTQQFSLCSDLLRTNTMAEIYTICSVGTSAYWKNHYNFGKQTYSREKKLSRSFIDLLTLNAITPVKFAYFKAHGKTSEIECLIDLARQIPIEKNKIIEGFFKIGTHFQNHAMTSQALLQLKSFYCEKNRCVDCTIGYQFLKTGLS